MSTQPFNSDGGFSTVGNVSGGNIIGNITLPRGGVINETNIPGGTLEGNTIALTPSGGTNADQQLLVYPTAGNVDANHLHLTTGNLYNTELFLGNDNLYVKLANTGNVIINSNDGNSNTAQWNFGTNGTIYTTDALAIQVPNGVPSNVTAITGSSGSWESNPSSDLATTGGTGTGLTVDVSNEGGYASTIAIHTPGDGYSNGDAITVTSGSSNATFTIGIDNNQWTFSTTGNLNVPQGGYIGAAGVKGDGTMLTGGKGNIASLTSFYANANALNYSSCVTVNADGTLNITTYGDGTGQLGQWTFANATLSIGNLSINSQYGLGTTGTILENGGTLELIGNGTGGGTTGCVIVGWNSSYGNLGPVSQMYFNPVGSSGNIVVTTGNTAGTSYDWTFDNTGNLSAPGNISATGNVTGANLITSGSGGNITLTGGNITGANVVTANVLTGNGLSVTGNTLINGPVSLTGGGGFQLNDSTLTANTVFGGTATLGPGSVTSTGTMSATGTITGGNLSATGNVYDSNGQLFNVPASYAKYTRTTQQTGSLVANTVIVCNVSENTFGSDISVNTGTGQVTLQAGKTYRLRGSIPGFTSSGGALQWCWYNETTPGWLGASGEIYSPSNSAAYGAAGGSAEAVFTPGTTTVVSFRILYASGSVTALGGNSDFSTTASYPWIDVQVIGGQAALTGFSTTGNITGGNIFGNGSTLTNVATQVTGTWTVTAGTGNYTITVPANQTYQLWVRGNVPNGIIAYTAMAAVTNTNVPVLGVQYGWNYIAGGNLILNTLPTQFVGTAGSISNAAPAVSNTNVFTFNITNNSGTNQTVDYGWTKIS